MNRQIWNYLFIQAPKFKHLPEWLRAWATVVVSICVVSFLFCLLIICVILVRLGIDALSYSTPAYQESVRNFLLAFASAFGATFLVWRAWVAHQQARAASEQARIALENHVTGIFSKSIELMGFMREGEQERADGTYLKRSVPNIEARLGAIYSLERIMRESKKDQVSVLETLCAYVRENSPINIPDDPAEASIFLRGDDPPKPTRRKDVQAALTVIGRRPENARSDLDLRFANLVAYDFSVLNFVAANFSGSFLSGANMLGGNFSHCLFSNVFLRSAKVQAADFTSSLFESCDFTSAEIDSTKFIGARFVDTDLREAKIKSLHIEGANFENAFGYELGYAVKSFKESGPDVINAREINKTAALFAKATYDEKTSVPQDVRDIILMMSVRKAD